MTSVKEDGEAVKPNLLTYTLLFKYVRGAVRGEGKVVVEKTRSGEVMIGGDLDRVI